MLNTPECTWNIPIIIYTSHSINLKQCVDLKWNDKK